MIGDWLAAQGHLETAICPMNVQDGARIPILVPDEYPFLHWKQISSEEIAGTVGRLPEGIDPIAV